MLRKTLSITGRIYARRRAFESEPLSIYGSARKSPLQASKTVAFLQQIQKRP
jgi:hypothetical protein